MDYRYCCFGEWDDMCPNCLIRCTDRAICRKRTKARKLMIAIERELELLKKSREEEMNKEVKAT